MNSFYSQEELKELGLKHYGENVLISRKCSIYGAKNISIANNVRIDDFCILSGKITIGNYCHIAAATLLFGGKQGIVLEDFSGLSSRCAIYAETDDYSGEFMTNPTIPDEYRGVVGGKVLLKKHSLLGSGTMVMPNVIIGEGTAVGAMGFVSKNLDDWSVYFGAPVRKIKERSKNILKLEEIFIAKRKEFL